MGKLHPLCLTTNSESIYILTIGRYLDQGAFDTNPDLWVLAKSQSNPSDLENLTWTIISTTPRTQLSSFLQQPSNPDRFLKAQCVVDERGVFTVSAPARTGMAILSARYDPFAMRATQSNTTVFQDNSSNSTTVGEWQSLAVTLDPSTTPDENFWMFDVKNSSDKEDTNSQAMLITSPSYHFKYKPLPVVRINPLGPLGDFSGNKSAYLHSLQTSNVQTLALGSGRLYTVLESDLGLTTTFENMNRTLRIFPFSSSTGLSSVPTSESRFNLDCSTVAKVQVFSTVNGGRFYYICERTGTNNPDYGTMSFYVLGEGNLPEKIRVNPQTPRHMYFGVNEMESLSMVSRANATATSYPLFALLKGTRGDVYWLRLPSAGSRNSTQAGGPIFGAEESWRILPDILVKEKIETPMPKVLVGDDDNGLCGESCVWGKSIQLLLGVLGGLLVLACIGGYFLFRCLRRRRIKRQRNEQAEMALVRASREGDADGLKEGAPPSYEQSTL